MELFPAPSNWSRLVIARRSNAGKDNKAWWSIAVLHQQRQRHVIHQCEQLHSSDIAPWPTLATMNKTVSDIRHSNNKPEEGNWEHSTASKSVKVVLSVHQLMIFSQAYYSIDDEGINQQHQSKYLWMQLPAVIKASKGFCWERIINNDFLMGDSWADSLEDILSLCVASYPVPWEEHEQVYNNPGWMSIKCNRTMLILLGAIWCLWNWAQLAFQNDRTFFPEG